MANLEFDIPITADMRFYIGELSNQFTALAILLLESQNKLSLQDDIRKHVPALPDLGNQITIEHLIHHTSGLRDIAVTKALSDWRDSEEISADKSIQLFASPLLDVDLQMNPYRTAPFIQGVVRGQKKGKFLIKLALFLSSYNPLYDFVGLDVQQNQGLQNLR